MPLPKPKPNEDRDKFISRCVSDSVTEKEFPDLSQRIAICVSQYDKKDE